MAETVISAYNAARGSGSSRSDGSGSADPDDLMKGRTFIPRMSEASRKLLIEALQKAKKKRQERIASRDKAESDISAASIKTGELMGQMSGLPQDRKTISGYDPKTKLSDVPALNKDNKDATLKRIMQEIGIDEEWAAPQLTENPNKWFSHLSGEPIEDRLTRLRDKEKREGNTHPNAVAIANMTDDEISAYARRIEDNIPYQDRAKYFASKQGREVENPKDREKITEGQSRPTVTPDLNGSEVNLDAMLPALAPTQRMTQALKKFVKDKRNNDSLLSTEYTPLRDSLSENKNGGKIPRYNKKRTIKYRK
jgi:hypothetical protein